jgi:hypothetical protein
VFWSVWECFSQTPPFIRLEKTAESDISKKAVRTRQYKALNGALNMDNKSGEEPGSWCSTCRECLVFVVGLFTKSGVC